MRLFPSVFLLMTACNPGRPSRTAVPDSLGWQPLAQAPVVTEATVVAFWLPASDTLADAGADLLDDFRAYTAQVAPRLKEGDIVLVATTADSIIVVLDGGPRRVIPLGGLDYPFGYVLVEPGFAETILTGVSTDDELLEQVDWYFGLEDDGGESPGGQVVRGPVPLGRAASVRMARMACGGMRYVGVGRRAAGSYRRYSPRNTGS